MARQFRADPEGFQRQSKAGQAFFRGPQEPEEITGGLGELLGYFMPHKVIAGKETMKAAGTVTKKLVKWLAEKGYVEDEHAPEHYSREVEDHFTVNGAIRN